MAQYFQVNKNLEGAPLRDHLLHGYESLRSFERALDELLDRWRNRTGEGVDERHGFVLLRFHDTPGGKPDEAWIPRFLLHPVDVPEYMVSHDDSVDETEEELNSVFGFD